MSSCVGSTKRNGIVRSWVVGFLGYAVAWWGAGLALQRISTSGGLDAFVRWCLIIELVPGVVGAALAVAVLRVRARPAWHIGLVASAGAIAAAAIVAVLGSVFIVQRRCTMNTL